MEDSSKKIIIITKGRGVNVAIRTMMKDLVFKKML